jgi:mRNA-degrading endonuclease RelE of RelBE toxin-antitoxin system
MTGCRIEMPRMGRDLIRHLPPALKAKIKAALRSISDDSYRAKELRDDLAGLRSYRVARIRIIYRITELQCKSSHLDAVRISMSVQPPNSARRCEHAHPLTGNNVA